MPTLCHTGQAMTFPPVPESATDNVEPLGEQPAAPASPEAGSPQAEAPTDDKIVALESQLEALRQLKAGEQTERLREIQSESAELVARHHEQEQYAALEQQVQATVAASETGGGEAAQAAAAQQISAAALLGADPEAAVAALVQLATASAAGFEKAVKLVREVAPQPGGAWILDEFHKRMTRQRQDEQAKGDAQGARG